MREPVKGVLAMATAAAIWGLSPLYYKAIAQVPPGEVLAHRTLWSLIFFGLVLAAQGRLGHLRRLLSGWRIVWVGLAALAISTNWFVFILSVQIGRSVQASLGYYIFPLVAVLFGMAAFGERLSRVQGVAVGLAALAVALLTLGLGVTPWISLILAFSFGIYGLLKKRLDAGPVVSVTAEVLLLAPLAALWLVGIYAQWWPPALVGPEGGWFGRNLFTSVLLAFSGVLTAVPLMLFSYASRRIGLASIGLVQYLNPSLQFLIATLVFREPFTQWHMAAFALIWTGLALYSAESLRQDRAARSALIKAGTSGKIQI